MSVAIAKARWTALVGVMLLRTIMIRTSSAVFGVILTLMLDAMALPDLSRTADLVSFPGIPE